MKALRKLFSLLLVVPALTLVACDNDEPTDPTTNPSDTTTQNSDPGPDPEPDPEPEPNEYAISQIDGAGEYTIRGVVDALTTVGAVIADDTGAVYYYNAAALDDVEIGDYVEVSGEVSERNTWYQFTSSATITTLDDEPNFSLPDAVELTSDIVDGWSSQSEFLPIDIVKYTWTTTTTWTTNSGNNYLLMPVDGYEGGITIEGVYIPSSFTFNDGWTYTVTAYFGGITSSRFANMYITDISEGVAPELESISVTAAGGATEVAVGGYLQLTATLSPTGATGEVEWSSSNTEYATVDNDGLVSGVAEGAVTIYAAIGEIQGSINLTVSSTAAETKTVTIDFSDEDINTTVSEGETMSAEQVIIIYDVITLDWEWVNGNNGIRIENGALQDDPVRFYVGHTLNISSSDWLITSIVVDSASSNAWNTSHVTTTTDGVTISDNAVSCNPSMSSIDFTFPTQTRVYTFEINLVASV